VVVVSDAVLDGLNPTRHRNTLEEAIPSIGHVVTSGEVVAALSN
jgi:hypothetical protein